MDKLRECPQCRAHRLIVTHEGYQCRECYAEFFSRGMLISAQLSVLIKLKFDLSRWIEQDIPVMEMTRRVTEQIDTLEKELNV